LVEDYFRGVREVDDSGRKPLVIMCGGAVAAELPVIQFLMQSFPKVF